MPPTDYVWMTKAVDEALWRGNSEYAIYIIPFSDHIQLCEWKRS